MIECYEREKIFPIIYDMVMDYLRDSRELQYWVIDTLHETIEMKKNK